MDHTGPEQLDSFGGLAHDTQTFADVGHGIFGVFFVFKGKAMLELQLFQSPKHANRVQRAFSIYLKHFVLIHFFKMHPVNAFTKGLDRFDWVLIGPQKVAGINARAD